jgi:hypothetical protein
MIIAGVAREVKGQDCQTRESAAKKFLSIQRPKYGKAIRNAARYKRGRRFSW